MKKFLATGILLTALAVPAMAQAQEAFAAATVNLRAGPGVDYPRVTRVPAGQPLTVYGCLDGYTWCDASWGDLRGWVAADFIAYPYENQRVPVSRYGAELRLPILTFSFGNYWDSNYRRQPWYGQRDRFENHAPPRPAPYRTESRRPAPPIVRHDERREDVRRPAAERAPPRQEAPARQERSQAVAPPAREEPSRAPAPARQEKRDNGPDRRDNGPDRRDNGPDRH